MNAKQELMPRESANVLTPMDMLDRAVAANASVETMTQLMALQERWEKNQARRAFDEAMAAAKAEIPVIAKNRHVGFASKKAGAAKTDYYHEDLAEIARTVDPILGVHGLSYRFRTSSAVNEPVTVTCILSHRAGHSEENTLSAGRDESGNKNSIHAVGSTITYLQRYSLKAALGLAASRDDDGVSADVIDPLVSEEQVTELQRLMMEADIPLAKFFRVLQIDKLEELPLSRYEEAKDAIAQVVARKAAKVPA